MILGAAFLGVFAAGHAIGWRMGRLYEAIARRR